MVDLSELSKSVILGESDRVIEMTQEALDHGVDVKRVVNEGLIAGMSVVGQYFRDKEIFLPEVLLAARAMKSGMSVLEGEFGVLHIKPLAKVVLGTVKDDLHDIGKNLVGLMLRGNGFAVVDLGIDVVPEAFIEAIIREDPHIIGMSALLSLTLKNMESTIEAIEKNGLRDKVRIMVGGAPVTPKFANEIGADGYAENAGEAVERIREFIRK